MGNKTQIKINKQMMHRIITQKIMALMVIISSFLTLNRVQAQSESELYDKLKLRDYEMFTTGFNECDIKKIDRLTASDFEFYHDKDGITPSKEAFLKVVKNDLCSSGKNVLTRVLDESSLKVFSMYREGELYGAIQTGKHSFGSTSADFTHLWLLENNDWKLSRVISYNHQRQKMAIAEEGNFLILDAKQLRRYEGKYQFSPEFILDMVQQDGKLYGDSQGEKVEIKAYDKHKFMAIDNSVKINFDLDNQGKVTGLTMVTPDGEMPARKIK